ncbi:hypothetical protein EDD18DRAFT_1160360, partial [Armillaria luteobubalina]
MLQGLLVVFAPLVVLGKVRHLDGIQRVGSTRSVNIVGIWCHVIWFRHKIALAAPLGALSHNSAIAAGTATADRRDTTLSVLVYGCTTDA